MFIVLGNWMLNHHNEPHPHALIPRFNATTDRISHRFIEACQRSQEILINEHDEDVIHWQWLKRSA